MNGHLEENHPQQLETCCQQILQVLDKSYLRMTFQMGGQLGYFNPISGAINIPCAPKTHEKIELLAT